MSEVEAPEFGGSTYDLDETRQEVWLDAHTTGRVGSVSQEIQDLVDKGEAQGWSHNKLLREILEHIRVNESWLYGLDLTEDALRARLPAIPERAEYFVDIRGFSEYTTRAGREIFASSKQLAYWTRGSNL